MPRPLSSVAFLVLGGVFLYFGAEWLVRGSAGIATKLRVRTLVIGLTVVAYGTSAPELVVGVSAALAGRGGIAFGNAVGSNVANVALILGVTSLVSPPKVDASLLRRELPVMALSALAVPVLLLDGHISRFEGGVLLLCALGYTLLMIRGARGTGEKAAADVAEVAEEAREAAGAPRAQSTATLVVLAMAGLGLLVLGGRWLVEGASDIATSLGVSERLVGLTIVAVGTSLPELATSIVAARRGHSELAVGNVIGSNIFNVLLILGASGVAGPLRVSLREARVEIVGLLATTLAAAIFLRGDRRITRVEGAILVVLYVLFLVTVGLAPRAS